MVSAAPLFLGLLPDSVVIAESSLDAFDPAAADPALPASAAPGRRLEFAAGRTLARRALSSLGLHEADIPIRPDRSPQWPAGFAGSITHTRTYAAAAAARAGDVAGLGIDLESVARFHPDLERQILTPEEQENVRRLADPAERAVRAAIRFSAKEAFYKAQHPLTGQRLGFQDAVVDLDLDRGWFQLRLLRKVDGVPTAFDGRFRVAGDLVAAALAILA